MALTFVIIVLARIVDVSLDTVRTAAIVQGRRVFAATLGFVQAVIYISVIAKVLLDVDHPVYVLAYGLGFALGKYAWAIDEACFCIVNDVRLAEYASGRAVRREPGVRGRPRD